MRHNLCCSLNRHPTRDNLGAVRGRLTEHWPLPALRYTSAGEVSFKLVNLKFDLFGEFHEFVDIAINDFLESDRAVIGTGVA